MTWTYMMNLPISFLTLRKSYVILLIEIHYLFLTGDFNARSENCWRIDMKIAEGTKTNSLTTSYGFSQIISEPIIFFQILLRSLTIFLQANQTQLLRMGSPIPTPKLLPSKCFYEFNLKIEYSPWYEFLLWSYKISNVPLIIS